MLICRCAWHRQYRGYPRFSGVASWRGWNLRFTDGICESCLERFRGEYQHYFQKRPTSVPAPISPSTAAAAPNQAA